MIAQNEPPNGWPTCTRPAAAPRAGGPTQPPAGDCAEKTARASGPTTADATCTAPPATTPLAGGPMPPAGAGFPPDYLLPPAAPSQRAAEVMVLLESLGVQGRRLTLAGARVRTVLERDRWFAVLHRARWVWHRERRQGRPPQLPTAERFLRYWAGVLRRYRVKCSERALRDWCRRFETGGPAALIDFRGRGSVNKRARLDQALFGELLSGLGSGRWRSVASAHRELAARAKAGNRPWAMLRTVQRRVRALVRVVRRNEHLTDVSPN